MRLVSLNVRLPRDVAWRGRTVRGAIFKAPVSGRRQVRRLNVDGDGQADLVSHGGDHRRRETWRRATPSTGQLRRRGFALRRAPLRAARGTAALDELAALVGTDDVGARPRAGGRRGHRLPPLPGATQGELHFVHAMASLIA
jgi:hypothetical protein